MTYHYITTKFPIKSNLPQRWDYIPSRRTWRGESRWEFVDITSPWTNHLELLLPQVAATLHMLDRNIELVHTKTKATYMDSSQYSGQFLGGRGRREGWSGGQLPHQAAGQQDRQASLLRLGGSSRIPIESLSDHSAQVDLDIGDYHMENNKGFTKVRTSRAKLFRVSISFLQGRLWQVFRVEGRAQRLVNCQAGLLLPMCAPEECIACMHDTKCV